MEKPPLCPYYTRLAATAQAENPAAGRKVAGSLVRVISTTVHIDSRIKALHLVEGLL
jgi:hypothetical protein